MKAPVIRVIDIETAPNLAHVWSFFKTNVGLNQVLTNDFIMSYTYKDIGCDKVYYQDCRNSYLGKTAAEKRGYKRFVAGLRNALDKADLVIAHNGDRFDIPWINGQAAIHGITPPSPFRSIDTLTAARRAFRFPSYKLEYLVKRFKCSKHKMKHKKFPGHDLWMECLLGNTEAWDEMKEYNITDVHILEELYIKMRPWIKNHPNLGVITGKEETVCPKCGSDHIHYRGFYYTNLSKFHKFQCQDCGAWGRDRENILTKAQKKALSTNAL